MTETRVTLFDSSIENRIYELKPALVDLENAAELLKKTKRTTKIEIPASEEEPQHFIHINPMPVTKSMLQEIEPEDFQDKLKNTLAKGTNLTLEIFDRFRFGVAELLAQTSDEKIVLFCSNGYFDTASKHDKIMNNEGVITPLKDMLVLQSN